VRYHRGNIFNISLEDDFQMNSSTPFQSSTRWDLMQPRSLAEPDAFLSEQGVDLGNRAFALEHNWNGWWVVAEQGLRIECAVDGAVDISHNLTVASDFGMHDRDSALMRALEQVLGYGLLRHGAACRSESPRNKADPALVADTCFPG